MDETRQSNHVDIFDLSVNHRRRHAVAAKTIANATQNRLSGFKCATQNCGAVGIWETDSFHVAKKKAMEHGWGFTKGVPQCIQCMQKKDRAKSAWQHCRKHDAKPHG